MSRRKKEKKLKRSIDLGLGGLKVIHVLTLTIYQYYGVGCY